MVFKTIAIVHSAIPPGSRDFPTRARVYHAGYELSNNFRLISILPGLMLYLMAQGSLKSPPFTTVLC